MLRALTTIPFARRVWRSGFLGLLVLVNMGLYWYWSLSFLGEGEESILVSVVMPCFNVRPAWLEQALQSIKDQTISRNLEVVIVDDGSGGGLEGSHIIAALEHHVARILLYRHRQNRGLSAARNTGAVLATGRYLLFLDPDDLMAPTAIEKLVLRLQHFERQPENRVAFIYPAVVHFERNIEAPLSIEATPFSRDRLLRENFIPSFALVERTLYLEAGGMCEGIIRHYEDYDFWLRLVSGGLKGSLLKEPLFFYRRHRAGRTAQIEHSQVDWREELRRTNPAAFGDVIVAAEDTRGESQHLRYTQSPCHRSLPRSLLGLWWWRGRGRGGGTFPFPFPRVHQKARRPRVPVDVMMIAPWLQIGGADYYDLEVLHALREMNFRVMVLIDVTARECPLTGVFEEAGAEVFSLHTLLSSGCDQGEIDAVFDYFVATRNPRYVYIRNSMNGYRLAQRVRAGHSALSTRFIDVQHLWTPDDTLGWEYSTVPFIEHLHCRIVVSEDLKSRLREISHEETTSDSHKIRVLHPPINLDPLLKVASIPICEDTRTTVMFVGRLQEQKDPVLWVQIAARLAQLHSTLLFLMIGDGYLGDQVREEIRRSRVLEGRILLVGSLERPQVWEHLAAGIYRDQFGVLRLSECRGRNVLVLPSHNEGLPLVILEAVALGIPVVTSNVGAVNEAAALLPALITAVDVRTVARFSEEVLRVCQNNAQNHTRDFPMVFTRQYFFQQIQKIFS